MAGILHRRCNVAALAPTMRHDDKLAPHLDVRDVDGMGADDLDEALRAIGRRRMPASTA